ncbi:hypothetical protein [Actinomadura violacea]|uniref:Uncharacterized protein n=1 Tax=Actinomadura violacea TaxID=2819934 RepID=A0ABS3RY37_9ACTN|nr:hypothetical protein [Actinomadura violacea]MBO2461671.1 hypothetical protein [Actinomadura violacea]
MSVSGGELRAFLAAESEGELLFADGLDDGLVGMAAGWFTGGHREVALYDYAACMRVLMAEGMDETEATEYLEFNVLGAWVGDGTPAFATLYRAPALEPLTS